jgi:hypothetical protein
MSGLLHLSLLTKRGQQAMITNRSALISMKLRVIRMVVASVVDGMVAVITAAGVITVVAVILAAAVIVVAAMAVEVEVIENIYPKLKFNQKFMMNMLANKKHWANPLWALMSL